MNEIQKVIAAANLIHEYCEKHIDSGRCKDCIFGDFDTCMLSYKVSAPDGWHDIPAIAYQAYDIEWDIDVEEGEDYKEVLIEYDLSNAVGIPEGVEEKDIASWLTDEYGYGVKSFKLR